MDYISVSAQSKFLLFVKKTNKIAITKYKGVGFAFSKDNLIYSDYHYSDEEDKEQDNADYFAMTASHDSIKESGINSKTHV